LRETPEEPEKRLEMALKAKECFEACTENYLRNCLPRVLILLIFVFMFLMLLSMLRMLLP